MDQIRRRLIAVAGVLLAMALTTDSEAGLVHQEVAKKVSQRFCRKFSFETYLEYDFPLR